MNCQSHAFEIVMLDEQSLPQIMALENACHLTPWSELTMRSCLSGRYSGVGVFADAELLGFLILEQAGPDITLMDICVQPHKQGQGIGAQLMMQLKQKALAVNAENIFLEVRVSNVNAISLYSKFSFVEIGRRKNYYPAKQGREDALLMALNLQPKLA